MILNSRKNWFAIFWSNSGSKMRCKAAAVFRAFRVPAKTIPVAPLASNLSQTKMLLQSLQSATAFFESTLDGSLHGGFSVHVVSKPALPMLLGKKHGQSLWLPYPIWLLGPGIVKSLEISQCDNVLEIKPFWFGEHFRTERFWKNTNSVSEPLAEWIVDSYTTCVFGCCLWLYI